MRNPQTVSLTWKPFPQQKPKTDNVYLVTFKNGSSKCIQRAVWRDKKFCVIEDPAYYGWDFCQKIIAFAELPEPYKEDTNSEKAASEYRSHCPTIGNGEPVMWD